LSDENEDRAKTGKRLKGKRRNENGRGREHGREI